MLDYLPGLGILREASLLFLKRTKTDIRYDTIPFKDVPGLQIIVRRQLPKQAVTPESVRGHDPRVMPIPPRAGRQPIHDILGESTQDHECHEVSDEWHKQRDGSLEPVSDYAYSDVEAEICSSEASLPKQETEDDNTTIDKLLKEYTTLYS